MPTARTMSNPPPSDIVFNPERAEPPVEKKGAGHSAIRARLRARPAPQIGEWPPRRADRTTHTNPWRRLMVLSLAVFAFTLVTWVYRQDDKPPAEETLQLKRDFDESSKPAAMGRMRMLLTSVAPVQRAENVGIPPWLWEGPDLAKIVEMNGVARENPRNLLGGTRLASAKHIVV